MYPSRKALLFKILFVTLILCLLTLASTFYPARGAENTTTDQEDFGRYLVDHQRDLTPFFQKNGDELITQATPLLLQWIGRIVFLALACGWVIDIFLGRGFAILFSPGREKFKLAFLYATGRLAINALLLISLESLLIASIGNENLESIILLLLVLFGLISAGFQVGWIHYFYRTKFAIAVLFYLTLIVIHGFLTLGIATPLSRVPASPEAIVFVDKTVTPKVEAEARRIRRDLSAGNPNRNDFASAATELQNQIDQAHTAQAQLRQQIESARNSEGYLYSRIVKLHAVGDLTGARDQFSNLLTRFPRGPLTGLAQGQLTQINSELAAQSAGERQAAAQEIRLAAQAQATLLSRTKKGAATLSELREALLGKTPAEVGALFGPPSETASDRWGFNRQMVFNPLKNEKSGLAVYFADGVVQSVDYYYGSGGNP